MQELQGVRVTIAVPEANGELYYDTQASITGSLIIAPLDIRPETLYTDLLEGLIDQWTDPQNPEALEGEDLEGHVRDWIASSLGLLADALTEVHNRRLELSPPITGADALAKYLPPSQNV